MLNIKTRVIKFLAGALIFDVQPSRGGSTENLCTELEHVTVGVLKLFCCCYLFTICGSANVRNICWN